MEANAKNKLIIMLAAVSIILAGSHVFSLKKAAAITENYEKLTQEKGDNFVLVFFDDFETPSLDLLKWNPFHRGASEPDAPHIVGKDAFAYHPENVTVPGDGYCHIQAEKRQVTVHDQTVEYTSGMIQTQGKFYQKGGRFEARIKIPSARGCIPAFWLMPNEGDKDFIGLGGRSAEIDIMEHTASMTDYVQNNVHWGGYGEHHTQWGAQKAPVENPWDWHVYALEWTPPRADGSPGKYEFFVDGILKNTYTGEAVSTGDQMIILSMALGDWGGPVDDEALPAQMLVDWCRVYQREDDILSFPEMGYLTDFSPDSGWNLNTGFYNNETRNGWTFKTCEGSNNIKIAQETTENYCLNFTTAERHTQWPSAQFDFLQTRERFVYLEFQTRFKPGHDAGYTFGAMFNDSADDEWTDLFNISTNGAEEKITGENRCIIPSLEAGKLYTFHVIYDNGGCENEEKQFYIFIDGICAAVLPVPKTYIHKIGIRGLRFHMDSGQRNGDFLLDNIYVQQNDAPVFITEDDNAQEELIRVRIFNFFQSVLPVTIFDSRYTGEALLDLQMEKQLIPPGTGIIRKLPRENNYEGKRKIIIWNNDSLMKPYNSAKIIQPKQ